MSSEIDDPKQLLDFFSNDGSSDGVEANTYEKARSEFSKNLKTFGKLTEQLRTRAKQSQEKAERCEKKLVEKETERATMKRQHENEIEKRESDELQYIQKMNEQILKELRSIESDLKNK